MSRTSLPPVLFHVGFSRTGTTTLQVHLFRRLEGCVHLRRRGPDGGPAYGALLANLREADDADFLAGTVRVFLAESMGERTGTLIVSEESLAGGPWRGRAEPYRTAERLQRVAPDAKVLIGVRHQGNRLRSLYSLYLKRGGWGSFDRFLTAAGPGFALDLDLLRYDGLVEHYQSVFGADRVTVVAFEHLARDPARYFADVAALVPAEVPASIRPETLRAQNPGGSELSRWILRGGNRFFRRTDYNPHPVLMDLPAAHTLRSSVVRLDERLGHTSSRLRDRDEALITSLLPRYEAGNARLVELTGLPLAELGYPLPG